MRQRKESRDRGDDLDGTRARIVVRQSSDEKRESTRKEKKMGHVIASCLPFYEARRGFLYDLRVAGSKHKYATKNSEHRRKPGKIRSRYCRRQTARRGQ